MTSGIDTRDRINRNCNGYVFGTRVFSICRSVFIALMISNGLQVSGNQEIEKENRLDAINSVRCKVRCLALLRNISEKTDSEQDTRGIRESGARDGRISIVQCLQNPDCEECIRPCNQPFTSITQCRQSCPAIVDDLADTMEVESGVSSLSQCSKSCNFLGEITSERGGHCPPPGTARAFEALCVEACTVDGDCRSPLKCCPNDCGRTCRNPDQDFKGLPEVPDRPTVKVHPRSGSIEIRWAETISSEANKHAHSRVRVGGTSGRGGPVLYIVESRWNVGPDHDDAIMTSWQHIAQTASTSMIVNDVTPGHWYQYRVTAVNIQGSRGSSAPSQPYTPPTEPRRPDPPANLTEGDTLIMGVKVAVNLHWFPPAKSDLPVNRYKLSWIKRLESGLPLSETSREHRHTIPGDSLMFQLPDLDPDSTYHVQVQAICHFGENRLKSERASIDIRTYPLPKSSNNAGADRGSHDPLPVARPQPPTPEAPRMVQAGKPFYSEGMLRVNVTWRFPIASETVADIDRIFVLWSPEACIADALGGEDGLSRPMSGSTVGNSFIIYGLRFDCRYLIRVNSVTKQGVSGGATHLNLVTPSCHEVDSTGGSKPDCPNSVARVPAQPSNLEHSFVIIGNNITARLSWEKPQSDTQILGYRIIWGQLQPLTQHRSAGSDAPSTEKASMITKVIPRDARQFVIGHLTEGVTYRVQVQALSRVGAGQAASVHFTTPLLQADTSGEIGNSYFESSDSRRDQPMGDSDTFNREQLHRSHDVSRPGIGQYHKGAETYYTAGCLGMISQFTLFRFVTILTLAWTLRLIIFN